MLTTSYRMSSGRWSSPCSRPHRARPMAAGTAPSRIGRVWPRSCTWPAPPPLAAAARPRAGLRLPGDLLAPAHRVGRRRRLRPAPPSGLGPPGRARAARLGAGGRRHHERAGQARGDQGGANPVDRGKPGTKLQLVCDGGGLPLTAVVTAATVNDTTVFQAVVADIPPIRTPAGRRRTRPAKVHADKGDDSRANRAYLGRRGIRARIARRQIESSARLGRHRWKVERALSWLSCFRRLQVRWDRDAGRWFAFVLVACAVVCFNRL